MIDILNKLEKKNDNGHTFYSLKELEKICNVDKIHEDLWIVLKWDEEKFWLRFAVMSFFSSTYGEDDVMLQLIFHGDGPTGALKECRHTFWGDEGYIFYPNSKKIILSLEYLKKYFDME